MLSQVPQVEMPKYREPSFGFLPAAFNAGASDAAPTYCRSTTWFEGSFSWPVGIRPLTAPSSNAPSSER